MTLSTPFIRSLSHNRPTVKSAFSAPGFSLFAPFNFPLLVIREGSTAQGMITTREGSLFCTDTKRSAVKLLGEVTQSANLRPSRRRRGRRCHTSHPCVATTYRAVG